MSCKQSIILFLLLTGRLWNLAAQTTFPFQNPVILDEEDGLTDNYVTAITKDHKGFMWFGTWRGLCRYDGSRIQPFVHVDGDSTSLCNNSVLDLTVDRRGRLWIGTTNGFSRYDEKTGSFRNYRADFDRPGGLPSARINAIFEDRQGAFWIGTGTKGLLKFDPEKDHFEKLTLKAAPGDTSAAFSRLETVVDITQDVRQDSILWIATLSGLVRFNKVNRHHKVYYHQRENKDLEYRANSMKKVYSHPNGKIFAGSWGGTVIFDPELETFAPVLLPAGDQERRLDDRMVRNILSPQPGEVWITYTSGLIIYDAEAGKIKETFYNDEENQVIYGAQYLDEDGRIWARTELGVFFFNPLLQQFKTFHFPRVSKDHDLVARAVLESGDPEELLICVQNGEGVYRLDRQKGAWSVIRPPAADYREQNAFHGADMIRLRNGRILVLSAQGLYFLSTEKDRLIRLPYNFEEEAPTFRRMVEGDDGEVWISSRRNGLYRLDLEKGRVRNYRKEFEQDGSVNRFIWQEEIFRDRQGNIWVRTATGHSFYHAAQDTFFNIPYHASRDANATFNTVSNFDQSADGRIWISGDDHEMGWADPGHPEEGIVEKIVFPERLRGDNIESFRWDQNGYCWINHERGLTRFNPATREFRYFNSGYGKPASSDDLMAVLSTGEIAINSFKSLTIFDPSGLEMSEEKSLPYLTSFKVLEHEMILDTGKQQVRLNYLQNFLSFEFSAIGYNLPENYSFVYQLEGLDTDWIYAGQRNYASYTHLSGGDYVFRLRITDEENRSASPPLSLAIHIRTPWWRTWWFWSLAVAGTLAITAFLVNNRIQEVKHKEQIKADFERRLAVVEMHALRAQMNPHFLFNCLNSIDYYILKNETEKASDYLNRFSRLIRLILQNSRANQVSLRDELEALRLYIEMESLRFDDQFSYEVFIGMDLRADEIEIPPMLLQPYVENAIWHGLMQKKGKGRLSLSLTRQNGSLRCVIEDNGIGREAAQSLRSKSAGKRKSMGMQITNDRIGIINKLYNQHAEVTITDLKSERGQALGTRVELDIPL